MIKHIWVVVSNTVIFFHPWLNNPILTGIFQYGWGKNHDLDIICVGVTVIPGCCENGFKEATNEMNEMNPDVESSVCQRCHLEESWNDGCFQK